MYEAIQTYSCSALLRYHLDWFLETGGSQRGPRQARQSLSAALRRRRLRWYPAVVIGERRRVWSYSVVNFGELMLGALIRMIVQATA